MGNNQIKQDPADFAARLHEVLDGVEGAPSRKGGRGAWLAKLYKVSKMTASAWLSGSYLPIATRVQDMAARWRVSFEWLYFGQGSMNDSVAESSAPYESEAPSQPVSDANLTLAFRLAAEALGRDLYLPPAQYAELGTLLYDLLRRGLSEADVLHVARRTAAALATGAPSGPEGNRHQD